MRRKQLSKSEIKSLNQRLNELYSLVDFIGKKDSVEIVENDIQLVFVNRQPSFFILDGTPIPSIKFLLNKQILKIVTVDMGAVKYVAQGADIMRPGITTIENDIKKNEVVVVIDEKNKKPLAVCKALFSSEEIQKVVAGKVLENLHYVGDSIWKSSY